MRSRYAGRTGAGLAAVLMWGLIPAAPAQAAAPGLSITVPTGTVSFGSYAAGARTITASLGSVTVSTAGGLAHDAGWTATVSTTAFTTGGGTTPERVAAGSVSYLSGVATNQSGLGVSACVPGQAVTPVDLSAARTAFSCTGLSLLTSTSLRWNPQVSITIGAGNVVGTYTGTITHSVA